MLLTRCLLVKTFYQYQPVSITGAGVPLTIAAAASRFWHLSAYIDGVEFTDSQGRRSVAKWASKATLDASTENRISGSLLIPAFSIRDPIGKAV